MGYSGRYCETLYDLFMSMRCGTLQMASRAQRADSPGWMVVRTGWSLGRHTQDGVRWSGTQISPSVLGRGRLLRPPSSLLC